MEIIYENSEIWADAMREFCSRKVYMVQAIPLHLQKGYTSSVRRSTWAPSRIWDALGWKLYESEKKILAGYWRCVGAINHPISAPKMKRASIFLNAASGFLKKYSPEAEKS